MNLERDLVSRTDLGPTFSRPLLLGIFGNLVLRLASNATGVMLAIYLRHINDSMYRITATEVGFFAVAFYVSELLFAPVFGALSDRYGRRQFIILGAVFGIVAVIMTGFTTLLPVLLVTRLLEGLSTATSAPAVLGLVSAETADSDAKRGKAMAMFEVATVIGIAGGASAGGFIWQAFHAAGFFLVAGIYFLSLLIFMPIRGGHDRGTSIAHSPRRFLAILGNSRVLKFAPAWLAINAIVGVWFAHSAFQLAGARGTHGARQFLAGGFSGSSIGIFFASFGILFMVGCFLWGLAYSRIGRTTMMIVSLGGVILAATTLLLINVLGKDGSSQLLPLLIVLGASVLILSGFTPAALGYLAEIAESQPEDRGTIMGFYSIFLGGGQLVGSTLGGPFADLWGVSGLIYLTYILTGVAMLTVLALHFEVRRRSHGTAASLASPS